MRAVPRSARLTGGAPACRVTYGSAPPSARPVRLGARATYLAARYARLRGRFGSGSGAARRGGGSEGGLRHLRALMGATLRSRRRHGHLARMLWRAPQSRAETRIYAASG